MNPSQLCIIDLPAAELSHKIRLLDLASLCARSVSKEVPYAEIAKTLKIGEDEVELWVIDGESATSAAMKHLYSR